MPSIVARESSESVCRRARLAAVCLAMMLTLQGCGSLLDASGSTLPGTCSADAPIEAVQKIDVLFVIDNSGSMAEEQEAVALELPAFVEALRDGAGLSQDFRVGVVTTSVYQHTVVGSSEPRLREYPQQEGRLQPVPLADGSVPEGAPRFLDWDDPELLPRFGQLVRQGTSGSGQETPLEAVRLALTELSTVPVGEGGTDGFLREGARLLVVVVTDEDDCSERGWPPDVIISTDSSRDYCHEQTESLTSVETYFDLFRNLSDGRGGRRDVAFTVIGPVARSDKSVGEVLDGGTLRNVDCPTSFQPGRRLRALAERFDPSLANLDSICKDSYRQSLIDIAGLANVQGSVEVMNVPDPRLLRVTLERADGEEELCTLLNGGLSYEESTGGPARVHFIEQCVRRPDDVAVKIDLICVG